MSRRGFLPAGGLAALGLLAAVAGCSRDSASGKSAGPAPPGVPVTVATAAQRDVPVQLRVIGAVEAIATIAVKTQVTGQLIGVHFQEGQDVKQGDLLFQLDPRPFQAELQRAEANLAKDLAQMRNAEVQVRRYSELLEEGAIAAELYDQVRTNAASMEATVGADRAALENARVQLGYTTIRSPLDGRTGTLLVQQGNMVKANDDTPLVTIRQIAPIYATFGLPEQALLKVRHHLATGPARVEAIVPEAPQAPARGTLTFVDNTVDRATGTIKLKGTFPNVDRRLWPGQFVNVVLTLAVQQQAVLVPSQAVQASQQGQQVFVVKPDLTVEARPVVLGQPVGNDIVVEKGLAAGERVVTEGQLRLVPGTKVEIKAAPPPAAPPERAG